MSRHYILDKEGNAHPTDVMTWARWFEEKNLRVVGQTEIGAFFVSTVFLGIDHRFGGEGPPILWETYVFHSPDGDSRMRRYCSRSEAEERSSRAGFASRHSKYPSYTHMML